MNTKLILIGLLLVLFSTQVYASLTDDLVSYYKLDETSGTLVIDATGNSNGTYQGTYTLGNEGIINYSFTSANADNVNNRINIANRFNGLVNWSISMWAKATAYTFVTTDAGLYWNNNTKNNCYIRSAYLTCDFGNNKDINTSYNWTDYDWHHVVVTKNGTAVKVYVDGTNTYSGSFTYTIGDYNMYFGTGDYHSFRDGKIDEIGLWSRALTSNEITELYNSGNGLTYPFDVNQIYADFDYSINNLQVDLNDTSSVDGNAVIDSWEWLIDGVSVSTDQNYSFTGTEATDYNVCLIIQDTVLSLENSYCQTVSIRDITPPVTTFESFQVEGTTDQNITLTCTDNNTGCKYFNYNINEEGWVSKRFDYNSSYSYLDTVAPGNDWATVAEITFDGENYIEPYNATTQIASTAVNTSYPTGARLKFTYSDESIDYSNQVSTSTGFTHYEDHTFTTFGETDTKILTKIEIQGKSLNGSNTARIRNTYIYYTIKSNPKIINNELNFLYSGAGDHNIQYFSTDNSDNNETIKTSYFTTYGNGRFYFKDENSGSDLTGVQVNFNGTDYDSGANNYIDFNFQTLSSTNTTYLFTLTKTGYSTRYYQTDLNYFGDFNTTFALLPESLATDLQFKMFPPTGSSVLSNTYIEFKDKDTNWTVTKLKSNADGELTANLKSDDQNYLVWISEGTYIYQAVQLTILSPKDEQTLTDITGNWRIEITDNISYQDLNIPQGTSKIIYLLPNTKYPFTIAVQDVAGTYFKRRWSKLYTGNPLTDTLQPYLLSADDGIAVKFVFQDPKRDSIQNIIVNIYKNIGGVKTLISNGASDVTGNALFFLIAGDKYWLDFTYNGAVIFETQNYSVTSSVVYWTLNLVTGEIQGVDGSFINLVWNPVTDFISKEATSIGYKVNGSKVNFTTIDLYTLNGTDKNIFYSTGGVCNTSCTTTILKTNIPYTTGTIYADVNVYTDTNAYMFTYTKKWIIGTTSNIDTQNLFINARLDFGCSTDPLLPCPLTTILSVVLMIILLGGMVFSFNFVNPKGLLIAGLGILAVFTYLGWFWWVALVLMIITSIFYLRSEN